MDTPKMLTEVGFNEILMLIPNSRDKANLLVHQVLMQQKIKDLEQREVNALNGLLVANNRIKELEKALDSIHEDVRRASDQIADQAAMIESLASQVDAAQRQHHVIEAQSARTAEPQDSQVVDDDQGLKAKIVHWLRTGPGAGETVRAKFAFKLAGMIESDTYLSTADTFPAY